MKSILSGFAGAMALLVAVHADAQAIGAVATMEGTVELGRAGTWTAAQPGVQVEAGDVVRTGRPGRARIVFADNSVLKVSDGSEIKVTSQVYDPGSANNASVVDLVRGKVRSIVSDYYKDPSARFEVRTPTAVAGVRGTDFVVAYDEADSRTQVVGVTGTVSVGSLTKPNRPRAVVGGRQIVSVNRDGTVSATQRVADGVFRQYLDGLDFVGEGGPESFSANVSSGATVAESESAGGAAGAPIGSTSVVRTFAEDGVFPPDATGLIDQPPGSLGFGEVGPF